MHKPKIIKGKAFKDDRGQLKFNNLFNLSLIKRIYLIENKKDIIRGWQGHKIEQRWFMSVKGNFEIGLIKIDNWKNPSHNLKKSKFFLSDKEFDVLHVPSGYITSIKSQEKENKLLVMSDYILGDIDDNFKFRLDYFKQNKMSKK